MPLSHTRTPNATISFIPKSPPTIGSRNKLPPQFVLQPIATTTPTQFDAPALLRPISFNDAQAIGIQSEGADTSGQVYAGFWRLPTGVMLPDWVIDGFNCAIAFNAATNSPIKRMSGVFYVVPGRTEWARSRGKGPNFVVKTMRQN
jgi:hypothetical protein